MTEPAATSTTPPPSETKPETEPEVVVVAAPKRKRRIWPFVLIGLVVLIVIALIAGYFIGENYEYPVAGEMKSDKNPVVVIESFRGNARITGADVDTVKVTGKKSIRSLQQRDADKADKDSPLEVVHEGGRIIIRSNQERSGNARISSEFDITVPKGSSIEARGRRGDFDITDINGSVDISSDNAGVRLSGIGGTVKIDTRNSDIIRGTNLKGDVFFLRE